MSQFHGSPRQSPALAIRRGYHNKDRSPESSTSPPRCSALSKEGEGCSRHPRQLHHRLCQPHDKEYKALYKQYKHAEKQYEALVVAKAEFDENKINEKIARGRQALDLRNQVNRRFFSENARNRGHIQWILKLDNDIKTLEKRKKTVVDSRSITEAVEPESIQEAEGEPVSTSETLVYRSLLSPDIPLSELSHLPDDHPVVVIKKALSDVKESLMERLYHIAPSLNDSATTINDPETQSRREPDKGDYVIRFVFREYLLWKADAELLSRANKTESIDCFLKRCSTDNLEDYIRFFEAFGRQDTLHFLRDAICDYLLPSSATSTVILGEPIATNDEQRKMTIEGWDILYSYFSNFVFWGNVESFCIRFEDVLLIKRLIALGRYGKTENKSEEYGWLNIDKDVSQELPLTLFQRFIAITKGYTDPPIDNIAIRDGMSTERLARCYLAGRMAKTDPLAEIFIKEMLNRVARYIVLVYEIDSAHYFSKKIYSRNDEQDENPWIIRTRSAGVDENLKDIPWTVEWSLNNILSDIDQFRWLREANMTGDYFEIIIIDREPRNVFNILDEVADALLQLSGDPAPQEIFNKAIQDVIPEEEQSQWLEATTVTVPPLANQKIADIHYEGNRLRAWDVLENDPNFIRGFLNQKRSQRDRRVTSKMVAEMESCGLITGLKEFSPARCCPMILQGTDGYEDLYFNYDFGPIDRSAFSRSQFMSEISLSAESLHQFAQKIKANHPEAVFAKGKINVHYCAWPMPAITERPSTFQTAEGHLYRWNVLPFDFPLAPQMWQYYIHQKMNKTLPFVYFVQTTFVVSSNTPEDVNANLETLLMAASKDGWDLSVPEPWKWTADIETLDLSTLWTGIRPALYRRGG